MALLNTASIKKGTHKAGKSFVLMFNRVSMYGPGHPFSIQAVDEFFQSLAELLKSTSPVVLICARGQFFLEDEPLDPSLNTFKMSSHFKKTGVASISIEAGLEKEEVERFVEIFLDTWSYPNAEAMREAAAARRVRRIRINHIFYQKVTEDDQVVSKSAAAEAERLGGELEHSREIENAVGMIAGKLLMEELDQSLSLKRLLADPAALSRDMVASGLAAPSGTGPAPASGSDASIPRQLDTLGAEIRQAVAGGAPPPLADLAEALLKMKRELLREIEAQKAVGVLLDPNQEIRRRAETVADAVILDLVRREYDRGRTPVERLAFILERLVPFPEDLKRLLPGIRDCLLGEGMPPADFVRLIRRLALDRQNADIAEAVRRAAEDIGVEGGELLERVKADASGFTRLLFLAAEIEKESGSAKPLDDILIEHLERRSLKLGRGRPGTDAPPDEALLRRLIAGFNAGVLAGLREGRVDARLIADVERRLGERLDASVAAIRSELARLPAPAVRPERRTLLQELDEGLAENHALKPVLRRVRASFREQGLDENNAQKIIERIEAVRRRRRRDEKKIDEIVFTKKQTRALLEIEIARSTRYGTDLNAVAFSIYAAGDRRSGPGREAAPVEVTTAILRRLRDKLRNTDWIGIVSGRLFLAVMPMTSFKEAHLAARRLLRQLNAEQAAAAAGAPARFRIAGTALRYDTRRMPDADAFLRQAEAEHVEVSHRLRNLQDFM